MSRLIALISALTIIQHGVNCTIENVSSTIESGIAKIDKFLLPQLQAMVDKKQKYPEFNPTIDGAKICFGSLGCFAPVKFWDITNVVEVYPFDPDKLNVTFLIYTSSSRNDPVKLDYNPTREQIENSLFDAKKRTKFAIHGYLESMNAASWMEQVKNVIFDIYPDKFNVIGVDWSSGSQTLTYSQAVANTRVVGAMTSNFIKKLEKFANAKASDVHLIGHSLGAQISGFTGASHQIPKIGRISGLDPAGPGFYENNTETRLDAGDADYVDVVHTDAAFTLFEGFGVDATSGHNDFYPNGGKNQPGCSKTKAITDFANFNPVDKLSNAVTCNHQRAWRLFLNISEKLAINDSCQFIGYECSSYDEFKTGQCADCGENNEKCAIFNNWGIVDPQTGLEFEKQRNNSVAYRDRRLYFDTTASPPYCLHHYQLTINLSNDSQKFTGKIVLDIFGSLRTEADHPLTPEITLEPSRTYRFLLKFEKNVGQVRKLSLQTSVKKHFNLNLFSKKSEPVIDFVSIEFKYMSNINQKIRESLSSKLCFKTMTKSKNSEMIYLHELC